jgi:hypothetical protein
MEMLRSMKFKIHLILLIREDILFVIRDVKRMGGIGGINARIFSSTLISHWCLLIFPIGLIDSDQSVKTI